VTQSKNWQQDEESDCGRRYSEPDEGGNFGEEMSVDGVSATGQSRMLERVIEDS